jgi:hypothetical protein
MISWLPVRNRAAGEQPVCDFPCERHAGSRAQHARANHEVGTISDERPEQHRERLRPGPTVSVQERDVTSGVLKPGLERGAVAAVHPVADHLDLGGYDGRSRP